MADSTSNIDNVQQSQSSKEVTINAFFDAASPASIYGRRQSTTSGLTFGYYGGRWGGFSIANGTQLLGANTTTYFTVKKSDGTVNFSTATTNWNDATNYSRAYKLTTGASAITAWEDHRAGDGGTLGGGCGGGGVANFTDLGDVPSAYTSHAGEFVVVNVAETALEFVSAPGGGDVYLGSTNAFTKTQRGPVTDLGSRGTDYTLDGSATQTLMLTLTANITLTWSSVVKGATYTLLVTQDGTGSRTLTFAGATVTLPTGAAIAAGASKTSIVSLVALSTSVLVGNILQVGGSAPPIADVWTTGGNMTYSAYNQGQAGGGAGVVWGGNGSSNANTYDSGVFSSAASAPYSSYGPGSCGSESDALSAGGATATSGSFNGSVWSTRTSYPTSIEAPGAAGLSSSAALVFGGIVSGTRVKTTRSFNGTTWSSESDFGAAAVVYTGGCGSAGAALKVGGYSGGGDIKTCEIFNGSTWSASVDYPVAIANAGCVGAVSSAFSFSGKVVSGTNYFDGVSWATRANTTVARGDIRGFGTPANAVAAGGYVSGSSTNSSEYYS